MLPLPASDLPSEHFLMNVKVKDIEKRDKKRFHSMFSLYFFYSGEYE